MRPDANVLEARIHAYELAFRMQTSAPQLVDTSDEPEHIRELYGLNDDTTRGFGRQCLLQDGLLNPVSDTLFWFMVSKLVVTAGTIMAMSKLACGNIAGKLINR